MTGGRGTTGTRRLVVVGAGMAGTRLAEEVLSRDTGPQPRWDVTLVGDERDLPYNRILLSEVLAGAHRPEDVHLLPEGAFAGQPFQLLRGRRVAAIHRTTRTVHLGPADGDGLPEVLPYDHLVLATGSLPVLPPLAGLRHSDGALHPRCFAFRTVEDCRGILAACGGARRAVVIGGGLLGLEAARGLRARGLDVEVLHLAPVLLNTQLDAEAGEVLARTLDGLGISVYLEARARAIESAADGTLVGVRLADGHLLGCDLVVFAAGVRPSTRLARESRLTVGRGITVDRRLRSPSDPAVSAIGDCAEVDGTLSGLVGPAWDQAAVLARTLVDPASTARYEGSRVVTRLKASGIELAALGETAPMPADSDGALEVVSYSDYARGVYKKVVLREGRVTGAILLGDVTTAGTLTLAIDRGGRVPSDRMLLLFGQSTSGVGDLDPASAPDEAPLCHCNAVDHGAVRAAARAGATSVAEVAAATRATTGCGTCRRAVQDVLAACPFAERALAEQRPA